eukprot:gene12815-12942_t
MAPALLAQPYAFAVMGWAGGIMTNLVMAVASWYCVFHQAHLFHYKGGRHTTYKRMGNAVLGPYMGRWGGLVIAALQAFINCGTGITNIILTGQLLQSIYRNLCTDAARCALQSTSAWIGLGGLMSYAVFLGLPNMASLGWAGIMGSVFCVYYCVAGMVMAGIDGNASTASYAISGSPAEQVFNALNGIGICLFLYGITVLPEIQAVLSDDPHTGSTTWPMVKASSVAHALFVPLYMLVGIIGYWAYGNGVASFLLFANSQPLALVVSAEVVAALQLQLVSQVVILPLFESVERTLLGKFSHFTFCRRPLVQPHNPQQHSHPESASVDANKKHQIELEGASSAALSAAALSRVFSLTHRHTTVAHLPHQQSQPAGQQHHHESPKTPALQLNSQSHLVVQQQARSVLIDIAEGAAGASRASMQPPWPAAAQSGVGAPVKDESMPADHQGSFRASGNHQQSMQDSLTTWDSQPPPAASWVLMFINRTLITGCMVLVACALPFFGSIMGFFGSVGFGPITYALPTVLYLVAYGKSMSRFKWWFNIAFIVFWLLASILGAIGSLYAIVTTASTYKFFS